MPFLFARYVCIWGLLLFSGASFGQASDDSIVIMVGVDGLRADTLDRMPAPNLQTLAGKGVRASMIPAMPTKTFVNFYTLATGLHPKHHGMISNFPYDRKLKRKFNRKTDVSDPQWWEGEPIWITAEKQGVKSATYFWVGSEVEFNGVRPSFWKAYQKNKDYAERIEEILQWLALPVGQRPRLIALYFSAVDSAAHHFGVGSVQEQAAVAKVDKHIGELLIGLDKLGLRQQSNIVVVADHGMANLSDKRVINIDPLIDLSVFTEPSLLDEEESIHAPFLNLYGDIQLITATYSKLHNAHPHLRVLRRGAFPDNYHFDHPQRGPDLMLLADTGWSIYASRNKLQPKSLVELGRSVATHGYDNKNPLMHATFIASGPDFKKNVMAKPFDNTEIYGLVACALNIKPANTDGHVRNVQHLMTKECK